MYTILNIHELLLDIMETMTLTQEAMALKMGTSQQSISNWLSGRSYPAKSRLSQILELAQEAGLDVENYKKSKEELLLDSKLINFKSFPLPVRRLCSTIDKLHPRKRKKILEDLAYMVEIEESRVG